MTGPDLFGDSLAGRTRTPDLFAGKDEGRGVERAKPQPAPEDETAQERELRHGFDRDAITPECKHTLELLEGDELPVVRDIVRALLMATSADEAHDIIVNNSDILTGFAQVAQ